MSDKKQSPLRAATMQDLQDIVAQAASDPAAKQKLAAAPEEALRQAGLIATPEAVQFIRSLGQVKSDKDKATQKDPLRDDAGEM